MQNILKKLEFDQIIEITKSFCISDLGRNFMDNLTFSQDIDYITEQHQLTYELFNLYQTDDLPIEYLTDFSITVNKLTIKGIYLTEIELYDLWKNLMNLSKILSFFKREKNAEKFPLWAQKAQNIKFYTSIIDLIAAVLTKEGLIKDNASNNLLNIRSLIAKKEEEVASIIKHTLSWALKEGIVEPSTNITIRNGRMLIPIDASQKNRIKGIVQDYSASGKTLYIEPLKAVELNNQITNLKYEEQREIIKILTELTEKLAKYQHELKQYVEFLALLDATRAKAILAFELGANKVQIVDEPILKLNFVYHPLLFLNHKKSGKKVIPFDLEINENQRIILISGPNAGGKSITLKAVGLIVLMNQYGFLVPAKENSKIGLFDKVLVDIGDDQSTENDLSTYSSHLLNMKNILEYSTNKTLILIDEFGTGTDPALGGALAEAILVKFLEKKVKAVITTHYSNLKIFASNNDGIVNAAMLFDYDKLEPLYILEIGHAGSSFAFEIALNIGLDKSIVEEAKLRAGNAVVDYEKIIMDFEVERNNFIKEKQKLLELKKQLAEKLEKLNIEKEKLLREKKNIIEKTKQQIDSILANSNSLIENTLRELKENFNNKEKIREIRSEFDKSKEQIKSQINQMLSQIDANLNKREKKAKLCKERQNDIKINDIIQTPDGITGKVVGIKDTKIIAVVGNIKMILDKDKVEKIGESSLPQKVKVTYKIESKPTFDIDLRGCNSQEAIEKLAKFIDLALVNNIKIVSILHGTGDGVLRKVVRDYLSTLNDVKWFGDANVRAGGQGITLVEFK